MLLDPNAKQAWNAAAVRSYAAIDWKRRWGDAVSSIRKAADLLDDPVLQPHRSLIKSAPRARDPEHDAHFESEWQATQDMSLEKTIDWYVDRGLLATAIRKLADAIEEVGWEDVVPISARGRPDHGVSPARIGRRGGTGEPFSRSRALLIREVDARLPSEVPNRYAVIADLVQLVGLKVTRQDVRGTLLKGKT